MGSYLPLSPPPFVSCKLPARTPMVFSPWRYSRSCRSSRQRSFACALEGKLEVSWIQADGSSDEDGCGGWSSVRGFDASNRIGFSGVILAGIGTSVVAILLAALGLSSLSRKGFRLKLCSPFSAFHDSLVHSGNSEVNASVIETAAPTIQEIPIQSTEHKSGVLKHESKLHACKENKRIVVHVPADPAQLEALNVLKILKMIDYDASGDDLCTRREYARWLVKANFILERRAKHRIVPANLIAGSVAPAFDDVNVDDPDFWCIQVLGESGIVSSRLSSLNSSSLSDMEKSNEEERFCFFPNNFISRLDLVSWTAMLEYSMFSELKKMSRTKSFLLDLSDLNIGASPHLLMDLISGDRGIVTRTFGNTRRLQPDKPVTKAQAAVALSSGTMAESIHAELARLKSDDLLRSAEMEEIRLELLQRGAIQKHWDEKLSEARKLAIQAERNLEIALFDLEIERATEDGRIADSMKEKMALECQQQLSLSLMKEVDEMREKLGNDRGIFQAEKLNLERQLKDLQEEKVAVFVAKSVLEAEKEAVQILRTWVEEEGRHIRARADVLQQAVQRWRVDDTALSRQ